MSRWITFFALFVCAFVNSCSCVAVAHVKNTSTVTIAVIVDGREFIIAPEETKKIRGIYYSGATVVLPADESLSFSKAFESILDDWPDIQNTYICPGLLCSKFSLQWTGSTEFLLLACDETVEHRVLIADWPAESSNDT